MNFEEFVFPVDLQLHQLDHFYAKWSKYVTDVCLRHLQESSSSEVNQFVLQQLRSYYEALDQYANPETILYFLFPSWRSNSLETPILFLGDIHPYLLTSLIRSFIARPDQGLDAWTDKSSGLGHMTIKMDAIAVRVKERISDLLNRMREVQYLYVDRFLDKWVSGFHSYPGRENVTIMETAASVMVDDAARDLVGIFVEANALRITAITDIVIALSGAQATQFLVGVCKFLAGFKHQNQTLQNSLLANQHMNHQPVNVPPQVVPPRDENLWPGAIGGQNHLSGYPTMQPYALEPVNVPHIPVAQGYPTFAHSIQHDTSEPLHDIFVGDLTYDVTPDVLLNWFRARYPSVRSAKIAIHQDSGRSKLYGFVSFLDKREQMRSIADMDGAMLSTRRMRVRHAAQSI